MMMWQRLAMMSLVAFLLAAGIPDGTARADEDFVGFLRGLHERGDGELAVYYLNQIKDRPDLSDEMKATWDLEMARSLRVAVNETPNVDLQQKYLVEAQKSLDKFLAEHADHEEAASAQMTSGDISLFRAQNALKTALRDKTKKDTLIPEARKLFAEGRPKFEKAVTMYKARIDKVNAAQSGKKKFASNRAERQYLALVDSWHNARFKVATVDYNVGLTYSEAADPNRKAVLQKAANEFNKIFQENNEERTGIYAKMWEGKAREEMGDFVTALDIYDEVMSARPPDKDNRQVQWAAMFDEVNRFRLMLLGRNKKYDELVADASDWLARHEKIKKSNGYQGIAMELAKAHLELAKTLKGAEAAKSANEAKRWLNEIKKTPSDYQKEATLLARLASGGEEAPIASFDEAIAVGDAATKAASESTVPADMKSNWQEAEKAYTKAIELSAGAKEKNRVLAARLMLATAQYQVGKAPEAYTTALTLAKENTTYARAPAAASLAVNIALYLYGQTRDAAAMERINEATELLLTQWPKHAEADDARIAKGKLKLLQNPPDGKGAIETFLGVNPASDRYPNAMQLAGQTHWMAYGIEKKKGEAGKPEVVQSNRQQAVELLEKSLVAFSKVENGGAALAQQLQDAQLLLAEVRMEGEKTEEALQLLQPMVDALKSNPPAGVDRTTLRILVNSLRAYAALGKVNDSVEVGNLLVTGGEDIPPVNGVLIEFSKMTKGEWKKASAELIAAEAAAKAAPVKEGEKDGRLENAKLAETNSRETLSKLLEKLNERKQYDLGGLVFLAESSAEIGLTEKARDQFQAIVDRAAADPAFAKMAAKAMTRVRSQLIGILRTEKKYEEALKLVEALLVAQPNALEPMIEKGNILQALAESDPKRYDNAVKWWTDIRLKLSKTAGKKPPEYYEVIYNAAFCLAAQKQAEKSTQAAQLLSGTLALGPELDGPDRVEMYKALLKRLPAAKTAPAKTAPKPTKK